MILGYLTQSALPVKVGVGNIPECLTYHLLVLKKDVTVSLPPIAIKRQNNDVFKNFENHLNVFFKLRVR